MTSVPAMSDLTNVEKRKFEQLFGMSSGYVLDFSNRTFQDFIADAAGRSIYDSRYDNGSGSKAQRLRAFWIEEDNRTVGRLMAEMLDLAHEQNLVLEDARPLFEACRSVVARLLRDSPVPEADVLTLLAGEKDFDVVLKAVRDAIDRNEPEIELDRLHTFVIKYVRGLCEARGLTVAREKPLHSLFGEYLKQLRADGHVESDMTLRILKSSISTLEAFNDVRNNQSLTHDNPVLNYDEALLIFNHMVSSVRFLRALERRVELRERQNTARENDIPF